MRCDLDDVVWMWFLFFAFRWRHWNHGNLKPASVSSTYRFFNVKWLKNVLSTLLRYSPEHEGQRLCSFAYGAL